MENSLLDRACSRCKKKVLEFGCLQDELLNFVYYLISKYLVINSSCGDRVRSY